MFKVAALLGASKLSHKNHHSKKLAFKVNHRNIKLVAEDIPEEYQWAMECEEPNWEKFAHFHTLAQHIESRDQCMGISSYMVTIADQEGNADFELNKCENLWGCAASLYEEGMSEEDAHDMIVMCVKHVTEVNANGPITFEDIGNMCASAFPTLEGSPLPHD